MVASVQLLSLMIHLGFRSFVALFSIYFIQQMAGSCPDIFISTIRDAAAMPAGKYSTMGPDARRRVLLLLAGGENIR